MAAIAAGVTKFVGGALEMEGHRQSGEAARVAGRRRNVAAQFEAEQMEQIAGQSIAASQRDAREEKRRAELAASRALALAAASGGGASDTTVVRIIAGLKGEGSYRSAAALYRGEEQARRFRMGAKAKRFEGAMAEESGLNEQYAHEIAGATSLMGTSSSLFGRYGGGGPSSSGPIGAPSGGWADAGSAPVSGTYG